ncbi:hypothetical protein [Pseudomonas citrulli]|uniref:Uncharacterized protein n=1 Tax=Pseudomonas citrulli TaxID=3064347 RepID=A0ABT9C1C3_9PSED|nr:hypothetical protein [Pseudomonas sp. K18]MDO7898597.1 hypothetical protein [Pseudomonas sp. K18]
MDRTHFIPYSPHQYTTPITIISEHHAWRTLSGIKTSDYYTYRTALLNGYHLQQASFDMRHPEEMIFDLSNIDRIFNGLTSNDLVQVWAYLDSRTLHLKSAEATRITGEGLSPEIAIAGPSKARLLNIKKSLIIDAFSHIRVDVPLATKQETIRGIIKDKLLIETDNKVLRFHNKFCDFYSQFISHENWHNSPLLNTRYIYESHRIWNQIKKLSQNKLFLLSAGLPLALGYLSATEDHRIFFAEVHRQNDSSLLTKDNAFQDIFPTPPDTNDSWLIIDKAYTGGSIRQATNKIREMFGYDVEVKTLALFPKSLSAFIGADYAVYAGKLFAVKKIAPILNREKWHIQLIKEQQYEAII